MHTRELSHHRLDRETYAGMLELLGEAWSEGDVFGLNITLHLLGDHTTPEILSMLTRGRELVS